MGGIGPHLGEILGCENVNFGPLFISTHLRGQTPDLTLEHYSPGGPQKKGFKIVNFGPLSGEPWSTFHFDTLGAMIKMFLNGGIGPHLGEILGCENVNFGPLFILTPEGPDPRSDS